ncbi:MAG: hypothetical protein HY075_13495, partial [Deltaproteobacteria bacterium]|nr:hypothetical protein [Deltaproteobacteria bacterium]
MRALIAFLLLSFTPAFAVPVKVAEAPFNNLALTIQAIQTAKSYLLVNIYDLSSQDVADALVDRIKDGLHVEILEEGQPVGGVSAGGKKIRAQLAKAMAQAGGEDHLYVMSSKPVTNSFSAPSLSKRRFRFDHAKYIVVDGKDLLVGSENYSPTGNPVPGNLGNRGWEVLVHDDSIAGYFKDIFRKDSDTSIGDVVDLTDRSQLVDARTG